MVDVSSASARAPGPERWLKTYLARENPTRAFAVLSWGAAGTKWLAKALNSSSEILCVHSINGGMATLHDAPRSHGLEYLLLLLNNGAVYLAAGDVHGVSRDEIPAIRAALGDLFRCAILVREPMARLRSQNALFGEHSARSGKPWGELDYLNPLIRSLGMDDESIPYAERLFIHGANQLNAIIEEIGIGPVYRMEDLTTSVEALRALVDHLTGSVVKTSAEWARAAIDTSRANAHVTTAAPFTERQLDIVRRVVRPDAWRFYRNLGYDAPDL
jgi:outer membrane murein-binding lipoprotein Lpp